jgi:hypothetical protein
MAFENMTKCFLELQISLHTFQSRVMVGYQKQRLRPNG